MFEKLVESTNEKEIKKQSAYFGLTTVFYSALVIAILVWSVFSFDLSDLNGNSDLTLESLVAPATITPADPPPPRINSQPKTNVRKNASQNIDFLSNPVENIKNSTKPPEGVTTDRVAFDEIRENMRYKVANVTKYAHDAGESGIRGNSNPPVLEISKAKPPKTDEIDAPPPPVVKKPEPRVEERKQTIVSKGVVNSIAVRLPKPAYPPTAKAVNASGAVNVQVTIDENGVVVSAVATSGHPLLKPAAVSAAKQAKFTPTTLSDQPVKVTGVIVYNFVP